MKLHITLIFIVFNLQLLAQSAHLNANNAKGGSKKNWHNSSYTQTKAYGTGTDRAYNDLLVGKVPKKKIVVAIIDSGVDTEHEDLSSQIWVNKDEIPDNGIDDDENGYTDDVHGWNFLVDQEGNDVIYDNLEATRVLRLSKQLQAKNEPYPSWLTQQELQRAADIYNEKGNEMSGMQQFAAVFEKVDSTVQAELGTTDYSYEDVAAIEGDSKDINMAKRVFKIFNSMGIDKSEIEELGTMTNKLSDYYLNFEYDPRASLTAEMKFYGNNHYGGSHAEHGTHVAGIVAATRGNEFEAEGVASSVAEIMVIRAIPDGDERDIDVANAIIYAVDNGANIINMSFGKGLSPNKELVNQAINYAAQKNVLVIHAAGNDSDNSDEVKNYPNTDGLSEAAINSYLTVGALAPKKAKKMIASFSNYGKNTVDIFAPGEDIYSTLPNNKYGFRSGTSMAAPVCSGVAALVWAYNPEYSASEIRTLLLQSATDLSRKKVKVPGSKEKKRFDEVSITGGVLNAYNALLQSAP